MERHFFCFGLAIARDKKPTWIEPRPEHVKAWRDMSDGLGPHWKTTLSRTDSQLEAELRSAVELVRRGWEKYWSDTPDKDGNGGFTVLTFRRREIPFVQRTGGAFTFWSLVGLNLTKTKIPTSATNRPNRPEKHWTPSSRWKPLGWPPTLASMVNPPKHNGLLSH